MPEAERRERTSDPRSVRVHRFPTLQEALGVLAEAGDDAKVLAGGQSLLPILRMRLNAPEKVVDLGRIDELRGVSDEGDHVVIGAMTVRRRARQRRRPLRNCWPRPSRRWPTRRSATAARWAVRSSAPTRRVTSVPRRSPSMPSSSSSGRAASGPWQPVTSSVTCSRRLSVRASSSPGSSAQAHRLGRPLRQFVRVAHQWSIVAVGATVRVDGGAIAEAGIGLTNMGATPLRATAVEQALVGRQASDQAVREACAAAEGREPAVRPQRRRRLPQAPRDGADPQEPSWPRRGREAWN